MTGTIMNAAGIVIGGVAGLTIKRQLSQANQLMIKVLLGAFTVYVGLSMTWRGLNGNLPQILKQLAIVLLALMLGNFTGKLLRLQKASNYAGRFARQRIAAGSAPGDPRRFNDGLLVSTLLFCFAPLGVFGSLFDGLDDNFRPLLIKAVMDGLATMAFAGMFGWGTILSVIPVAALQSGLTLLARWLTPFLAGHELVNSLNATGGLLVFAVSLIILELKKIELADYFPSLVYAPVLTWWWR